MPTKRHVFDRNGEGIYCGRPDCQLPRRNTRWHFTDEELAQPVQDWTEARYEPAPLPVQRARRRRPRKTAGVR